MILEETVNKLVRDIVNTILATADFSIAAKQDAPRPSGSYADVDFLTDTGIGWEYKKQENNIGDDNVTETIQGARVVSLSIGFYRDDAMDNARKVRTAFMRQSILDMLRAANMGLVNRTEVRDLSEVLESSWEQRAQFDLTLSAVGTDIDMITSILHVSISGEFQTSGKSIPISAEVNT